MTVRIRLSNGQFAIVDDIDGDLASLKWSCSYYGYAVRGGGRDILHRVILERMIGRKLDKREYTDHINGNTLDNRRSNLRLVTPSQNRMNEGIRENTSSPYKGVSYRKKRKKWRAYIKLDGKYKHLGAFDSPEQAARAYDSAASHFFGEYARLNFPNDITPFTGFPEPPKPTSDYHGVIYDKSTDRWLAYIYVDKKQIKIGRFKDEKEAAMAYDSVAKEYLDDSAKFNFPDNIKPIGNLLTLSNYNTSGFRGVSYDKRSGRWIAHFTHNKNRYSLGYHNAPEQAARAYDEIAKKHLGKKAKLNFPD